jgi:hypothetical protein
MRRILIAKDLPLGQNKEIEQLAKGQIGIYGMNKDKYLFEPAGIGGSYEWLQVYLGGTPPPSDTIDMPAYEGTRLLSLKKAPYKKAINAVWRVSVDYAGKSSFDEFLISIAPLDTNAVEWVAEKYSVTGASKDLETLYCKLADQINTKSTSFTAKATAAGLDITSVQEGVFFQPSGRFVKDETDLCNPCVCVNWEVKELVQANGGSGSCKHIQALDFQFRPHKGAMEGYWDKITPTPALFGECEDCSTAEFDLYLLHYANANHASNDLGREVFEMTHELILAYPKGSAGGDEFQLFVETLTGKKFIISPLQ